MKSRAETSQPGSEFDNFNPRLKSGIFKCISWLNGSFFGGDDWSFLKEALNTCLIAPISPPFCGLHICSLRLNQACFNVSFTGITKKHNFFGSVSVGKGELELKLSKIVRQKQTH
jgi:hypothetical protein